MNEEPQSEMGKIIEEFKNLYPNLSSEFIKIFEEQYFIFAKKMLAYGIDNISLGTDLSNPVNKEISHKGVLIRSLDKINRLKNLSFNNQTNYVEDENIKDTWSDLGNYSIIAQIILNDKWKK